MGDDGDFDFRRPPERREPKKFEPPPWEKEAFPERYRDEPDAGQQPIAQAGTPGPGDEPAGEERDGAATTDAVAAGPGVSESETPAQGPSEAEVLEMMAGLSSEEPDVRGAITTVTIATSIVVGALGMVLIVWAMAAFVRAGAVEQGAGIARTGAVTMGVFGVGFVSAAAWMLYRLVRR